MQRSLVIAGAVGLVMAGVLAAAALEQRHPRQKESVAASPNATVTLSAKRATVTKPDEPPATNLDTLLADGSPRAWGSIASLYPAQTEAGKRKVLEHIAKVSELPRAVAYLLATVGEDPTPPAEDRLVEEAASLLKSRLSSYEDFDYTRRAMVMQKVDKRRWVLAAVLIAHAKDLDGEELAQRSGTLQAKFIDVHAQVRDEFVQSRLTGGLRALGAADAALILERRGEVSDRELAAVTDEQAAVKTTLAERNAR
jgi:hypothetical protein